MTYGLTILNNDNRIQIDENYSLFYTTTDTASSAAFASSFPTPNTDLIAARPVGTTGDRFMVTFSSQASSFYWGGRGNNTITEYSPQVPYPTTNGYRFYTLRKFADNINANSGYGMAVYSSTNQTLFSATTSNRALEVVTTGTLPASPNNFQPMGSTWSGASDLPNVVYYPSSTGVLTDLDKHYCVLNPASSFLAYQDVGTITVDTGLGGIIQIPLYLYFNFVLGYEYIWTGANSGRIKIHAFWKDDAQNWSPVWPITYAIMKEVP